MKKRKTGQTVIHTDTQTYRHRSTDRQTVRQAGRQADRQAIERQKGRRIKKEYLKARVNKKKGKEGIIEERRERSGVTMAGRKRIRKIEGFNYREVSKLRK